MPELNLDTSLELAPIIQHTLPPHSEVVAVKLVAGVLTPNVRNIERWVFKLSLRVGQASERKPDPALEVQESDAHKSGRRWESGTYPTPAAAVLFA